MAACAVGGSAWRRRARRLRAFWRHEQHSVRMAVAAALHHSHDRASGVDACGLGFGGGALAPAHHAAPAPVTEYLSSAQTVGFRATAPADHAAPVPVTEYVAPASTIRFCAPAPAVHAAPAPATQFVVPAPVVEYIALVPVVPLGMIELARAMMDMVRALIELVRAMMQLVPVLIELGRGYDGHGAGF